MTGKPTSDVTCQYILYCRGPIHIKMIVVDVVDVVPPLSRRLRRPQTACQPQALLDLGQAFSWLQFTRINDGLLVHGFAPAASGCRAHSIVRRGEDAIEMERGLMCATKSTCADL